MAGEQGGFFQEVVKIGVMTVLAIFIIGLATMSAGLIFEEDIFGLGFGDDDSGVGNDTAEIDDEGEKAESGEGNGDGAETEIEDRVNVSDHRLVREDVGTGYESVKVEGRIENVGDSRISSLEVRVRFYDGDGFTGNMERATVTNLAPNESWNFDVSYPSIGESAKQVNDYEIRLVE